MRKESLTRNKNNIGVRPRIVLWDATGGPGAGYAVIKTSAASSVGKDLLIDVSVEIFAFPNFGKKNQRWIYYPNTHIIRNYAIASQTGNCFFFTFVGLRLLLFLVQIHLTTDHNSMREETDVISEDEIF